MQNTCIKDIVTWNYNCLLRIIIKYLKSYNCANYWFTKGILETLKLCAKKWLSLNRNSYFNHIIVYRLSVLIGIRGAFNKFPDFFHMGTFIDSTNMKL